MFVRAEVASNVVFPARPGTFAAGAVAGARVSTFVEESEMYVSLCAKVTAMSSGASERVDFTIFVNGNDVMTTPSLGGNAGFVNGIACAKLPAGSASGPNTIFTAGGAPATLDLSTTPIAAALPIFPGTLSIAVDIDGVGAKTIVDDGAGHLSVQADALPLGGTINYTTGAMTGITGALTALSTVDESHSKTGLARTVLVQRTVRITRGVFIAHIAAKYTTGPIAVAGAIIPCELTAFRHSNNALLGHGAESKSLFVQ